MQNTFAVIKYLLQVFTGFDSLIMVKVSQGGIIVQQVE
jgi:hypothetical protein